jgi:ATP-dependent DNA ligase
MRSSMMASASWLDGTAVAFGCSRGTATISPTASQRSSAGLNLPARSCLIDGEAIAVDERGVSVFDLLRYRHHDHAAVCAFDLIELDGNDPRRIPIEESKGSLAKLLSRPYGGIALNQHYLCDGAAIFKHVCALGCEGVASKRLGLAYRSARTDCWIKVKKPAGPAVRREAEEDWDGRRRRR